MTEPLPYIEDVQKLTDAKEISQAYVSLKETNRYIHLHILSNQSSQESLHNIHSLIHNILC